MSNNKTERDVLGAVSVLGEIFGTPEIAEAVRRAEKNIPKARQSVASRDPEPVSRSAPTDSEALSLSKCEACGTYYLDKHACEAKTPEHKYCAFDASGAFLGAFDSPLEACTQAGEDGFMKRLTVSKVPK